MSKITEIFTEHDIKKSVKKMLVPVVPRSSFVCMRYQNESRSLIKQKTIFFCFFAFLVAVGVAVGRRYDRVLVVRIGAVYFTRFFRHRPQQLLGQLVRGLQRRQPLL